MEVRCTPEQEAKLAQMARVTGGGPEDLVKEMASRFLDQDARFHAAVAEGAAKAARGAFIEESEIDGRFEPMLNS